MRYVCKLCGKEYEVRDSIYRHLRSKHGWDFEQGDVRDLIERKMGNDSKYVCFICRRKFTTKSALKRHMTRIHRWSKNEVHM